MPSYMYAQHMMCTLICADGCTAPKNPQTQALNARPTKRDRLQPTRISYSSALTACERSGRWRTCSGCPSGLGELSCFDDNYFLLWILGGGPGCRQHGCGCACICRHIVHVCNYSCCTYRGTRYYTSSPATYTQDLLKKRSASFSQLREPVQPTLQSSECVLTVPESRWMHWQLQQQQQQQQQQQDSP